MTRDWIARHASLRDIGHLKPALWFDFPDTRLEAGIRPNTVNREMGDVQEFVHFLADAGRAICDRLLRVRAVDCVSAMAALAGCEGTPA